MSAYLKFCKTCLFERAGECRFGPPTAAIRTGSEWHLNGVWPVVMPNDWCYQWRHDGRKEISTNSYSDYGENPEKLLTKESAR